MFDVNQPATLQSLRKWWVTFCETAPIPDDEAYKFCTVLVGNKMDLVPATRSAGKPVVSEEDTQAFVDELVPPPPSPPVPDTPDISPPTPPDALPLTNGVPYVNGDGTGLLLDSGRSNSIDILNGSGNDNLRRAAVGSRATSRSRFAGTLNTVRTGMSIYHTPSSSYFDSYMSAPSSPPSPFGSPRPTHSRKRNSQSSISTTVSTSTLRPRENDDTDVPLDEPPDAVDAREEEPDVGPRLFFTSAKTGDNVDDVFAYVARRVVARWEWDETHIRDSLIFSEPDSDDTVRLGTSRFQQRWPTCC